MDMQKIIERVQKMLALARDKGASQGERDNAMSAVHKYLAQYNLDMEVVEGTAPRKKKTTEGEDVKRDYTPRQFFGRPWACNAAMAVADLCFCIYLYRSGRVSKDSIHIFVGRTANAVTASYLAEFVVTSIHQEGRKRQRQEGRDNPWFLSFAWGAALEVRDRVAALKARKDVNGSAGKELVLVDYYTAERAANEAYKEVAFPNTKKSSRGKGIRDREGYADGRVYGSTINLDRHVK